MNARASVATNDAALQERHPGRKLRFYNVSLSEREAWFGAATAALFNALGMLMEAAIMKRVPGISARPAALSGLVGLVLLALLFIRRKTPSVRWASIAYCINTASVVATLLWTNPEFAALEPNWVPFQASKLGCLITAMVAPGFWVGMLSILAYCISSLLQLNFFFPPEIRAEVTPTEPWPMLAFTLAGVLALVFRFRRAQLEQELSRIQAQHFAIRRLANAFLGIRDLMNTPLQVIELSVDLLRNSNEPSKPNLDRIDRSVQNLRDINTVLIEHEKEIEWQSGR